MRFRSKTRFYLQAALKTVEEAGRRSVGSGENDGQGRDRINYSLVSEVEQVLGRPTGSKKSGRAQQLLRGQASDEQRMRRAGRMK